MTKHSYTRKTVTDEIKTDILTSKLSVKQLAEKHSITTNTVYEVLRNRPVKK